MRVKGRVTRGTVASGEGGSSQQQLERRATRGSAGAGPSGVVAAPTKKRGRGRPPGSKNKVTNKGKGPAARVKPPPSDEIEDDDDDDDDSDDGDDENHAPPAAGGGGRAGRAAGRAATRATAGRNAPAANDDDDDDEHFQDAEGDDDEDTETDDHGARRGGARAAAVAAAVAAANAAQQQPRRRGRPVNPLGRFIGGPQSPGRRAAEEAAARDGQPAAAPSPTAARRPAAAAAANANPTSPTSPARRLAEQGVRQADLDQIDRAKQRGNTVRLMLQVELSEDLHAQGAQLPAGAAPAAAASSPSRPQQPNPPHGGPVVLRPIEVPALCEVRALRRYINYYSSDKLPPAMQRLRDTLSGAPMHDLNARGEPNTLGSYGLSNGASITLTVVPPETEDQQLAVGAALADAEEAEREAAAAAAAQQGGGLSPRRPGARPGEGLPSDAGAPGRGSRQGAGRWSLEEMEALVGGIEAWGLSWADVRRDPRLAARDGVNCKDKFRNMCLTVLQGRTERKVAMPYEIRERVTRLAEQYHVRI